MGACIRRFAIQSFPLLALALFGMAAPARASAQQQMPQVSDERLAIYVKAYIEIGKIRDEEQAEFAKVANKTPEAQEGIRQTMRERIAGVLEADGMANDEYERITHIISFDQDARAKFDELVAEASTGSGSSSD